MAEQPKIVVDIGEAMKTLEANPDLARMIRELITGERFYMTTDNDSHWYVVPDSKRAEWDAWCEIPSDDERAWEPPEFATAIGGSPSMLTFTDPGI